MIPEVNFTRSHHFCSIVSDMAPNLQDVTVTCSNCGVLGVNIDPCEYCRPTLATMPQVQTTHARTMLCEIIYAKYLRGETRSIYINSFIVSPIMHEQTNLFFCTTNFCLCRAALRCEEVTLPKAESEGRIGGRA